MTASTALPTTPVVACPAGEVVGVDRGASQAFSGIRFATSRRFSAPEDIAIWHGRLLATGFGPQAPQNGGTLEQLLGGSSIPMDEDCLFLNVFTPASDAGRRPVLVWIHGGAYVTGTGAMPWYDGAALAERGDVVVVTINYRLGALGFLDEQNNGVLDQASALRWVARNIAAFGGDPDNVTIFGESAGGSALLALMATPAADDFFHQAFAMSPSILQLRDAAEGTRLANTFFELLGTDSLDDAREAGVDAILAAQAGFPASTAGLKNFSPTSGTPTIPAPVLDVAARDDRPLVVGTNRDEMLLFTAFDPSRAEWTTADVHREFERRFGEAADDAIDGYRRHRPDANPSQLVSAMQTDEVFRVPTQRLAEHRALGDAATWMYSFDFASRAFGGVMGACHGLDIPFAFDNLSGQGAEMFTGPGDDRQAVADQFADAIVTFARSGDPGWPSYDATTRATQRIGLEQVVVKDPDADLRELWCTPEPDPRAVVVGTTPLGSITDVAGVTVGHHQRTGRGWQTGTTVVAVEHGATPGVDVRGGGPGTRETDALAPENLVQEVHAVCLTGGSAYGLAAADGVMAWLEHRGLGFPVGPPVDGRRPVVPIVPAAVIFDLERGGVFANRPDASFGERAARNARRAQLRWGAVGAGAGARAGGLQGGVGTASTVVRIEAGPDGTDETPRSVEVVVGALAVVNANGSVIDPATGLPWMHRGFRLRRPARHERDALRDILTGQATTALNTTIGVVATSARLTKAEVSKVAAVAHDGMARAVHPAHSMFDGDTVFGLATGATELPGGPHGLRVEGSRQHGLNAVLAAAAETFAAACTHAILTATQIGAAPAYRDICPSAVP